MTTSKAGHEVIIKGQRANRSACIANCCTFKKKKQSSGTQKFKTGYINQHSSCGECVCDTERESVEWKCVGVCIFAMKFT